jgi:hypothetical protein
MEPNPREPTGDLGYDMAHADMAHADIAPEDVAHGVTGGRPGPQGESLRTDPADARDDGAGDLGYDEAHDFRR